MDTNKEIVDPQLLDQPGTLTTTYGTDLPHRIPTRDIPPEKPLKKKAKVASDGAYSPVDTFEDPSDVSETEIVSSPDPQVNLGHGSSLPAEHLGEEQNQEQDENVSTNLFTPPTLHSFQFDFLKNLLPKTQTLTISKISVICDSEPLYPTPFSKATMINAARYQQETQTLAKLANLFINGEPCEKDPCPFLGTWPLELRELVYSFLLVVGHIDNPANLVETKYSTFVFTVPQGPPSPSDWVLDPTILRTCRQIYNEALPILYGRNNLHFDHPRDFQVFRFRNLFQIPSEKNPHDYVWFNLQPNLQGRLTMIRKLTIIITAGGPPPHYPNNFREYIMNTWKCFLQEPRNARGYNWQDVSADFPALDELTLDFLDWDLEENTGVITHPFVRRFETSEGLSRLEIRGIKHRETLDKFRVLLKKGGRFVVSE